MTLAGGSQAPSRSATVVWFLHRRYRKRGRLWGVISVEVEEMRWTSGASTLSAEWTPRRPGRGSGDWRDPWPRQHRRVSCDSGEGTLCYVAAMPSDDADRAARRAARSAWPLKVLRGGEGDEDAFLHELSVEERLAAQHEITEMCWRIAGKEIPDLPRSEWPLKVIRRR